MTPSSDFQTVKAFFHAMSKTNTESKQYVFESLYKSGHNITVDDVWADVVGYAGNQTAADAFAATNPTIVKAYTLATLTEVPGSNGEAWYLSDGGVAMRNWIAPTDVPAPLSKTPSYGYEARLYTSSGTRISPTLGVWVVDHYAGLVLFQQGQTPSSKGWGIPKISCYVYVGARGTGGLSGPKDLGYAVLSSNIATVDNGQTVEVDAFATTSFSSVEWLAACGAYSCKINANSAADWSQSSIVGSAPVEFDVILGASGLTLTATGGADGQKITVMATAMKAV